MSGEPDPEIRQRLGALARIMEAARERYVRVGAVRGKLKVPNLTESERMALQGVLGRYVKTRPGETLELTLAELDELVRSLGLATGLPEAVAAFSGHEVVTRQSRREAEEERWQGLLSWCRSAGRPGGRSAAWLSALTEHDRPWLRREFATAEAESDWQQSALRQVLTRVAAALDRLPADSGATQRLPVFAALIAGDPHGFDPGAPAGRLLVRALWQQFGEELAMPEPPAASLDRGLLLSRAGLLVDSVSSHVACFGLQSAVRADGSPDRQAEGAGQDRSVMLIPLRQVSEWRSIAFQGTTVYAVENPSVFEALVDTLSAVSPAAPAPPLLVCTSGYLSVAAVRLLDLAAANGATIAYSGDFDLNGLRIAESILHRFGGKAALWAMDADSYELAAAHPMAEPLSRSDLDKLSLMADVRFGALLGAMARLGKRAYQEALLPLLTQSLSGRR